MKNTFLPIAFEIIELLADKIGKRFKKVTGSELKPAVEMTSTDFEKNETCSSFRKMIGEHSFHPKKLYTYIFEHIRFKYQQEAERKEKHPDGAVLWKITSSFPKQIFEMLDYEDLNDFLIKNQDELQPAILERQKKYIDQQISKKVKNAAKIKDAYHCYISAMHGLKIAKLAIYDTGKLELQLKTEEGIDPQHNSSHFYGFIGYQNNFTGMDFWKVTTGDKLDKRKSKTASEVSFKFLSKYDFKEHVFIFGTYSAINTFNHDSDAPARVSGPVILEYIPKEQYNDTNFTSVPYVADENIPPEIAAKVKSNRWEEERSYTRKATSGTFEERRKEELALIDKHNPYIRNPRKLPGVYFCLIFSKTHKSIRKILIKINTDMTVEFTSTKYVNQQAIVKYQGDIKIFANGLLVFKAKKKHRLDYLEGKFRTKDTIGTMYGSMGGIIRDVPKEGRAVLVPFSEGLGEKIDSIKAEFIEIDSPTYSYLDEKLNLTRFFAGKNIDGEHLNLHNMFNNDEAFFNQLISQKAGHFEVVVGQYEEYYFDNNENIIRKDYWLISKNGEAFMCGRRKYEGKVQLVRGKYIINFQAADRAQMPVIYMVQQEKDPSSIFSGIFNNFSEDGRDIAGNKVFLHKISDDDIGKATFFSEFEGKPCSIPLNSQAFKDLNSELFNLGNRLSGPFGNYLLTGPFDKNEFQNNTNRVLAYSFFNSACFKAQSKGLENAIEALGELNRAFQHGFSDTILLNRELKEGGALFAVKEMIDVEELKIKPRYLKVVS